MAWEARHGVDAAVAKFGVGAATVRRWHERHPEDVKAAKRKAKGPGRPERTSSRSQDGARAAHGKQHNAGKREGARRRQRQDAARRARHGRRFSVAEKKAILAAADADGVTEAANEHGTSRYSIYEWRRRLKSAKTGQSKDRALEPRSSRPKRNARKLSEERYNLIAETWKKNQALGPRQVRNKVRRDHGVRVGTSTARKVVTKVLCHFAISGPTNVSMATRVASSDSITSRLLVATL